MLSRMNAVSLEILMHEAQNGNRKAYHEVLEQSARLARAFISKRIQNPQDSEDIVQEVLVAIHKARHTYHSDRPYKPWLFALTQYKLNDFLRRCYRRSDREQQGEEVIANIADDSVTFGDRIGEQLDEALEELSDKQREILTKAKIEGYSSREVAEQMNMTESAVKVAIHRSMKQLKKKFEDSE